MTNRSHYLFYSLIFKLVGLVFLLQIGGVTLRVIKAHVLFRETEAKVVGISVTEIEQQGAANLQN